MPQQWGNMTMLSAAGANLADQIRARIAAENRALRGGVAIDALQRATLVASARQGEDNARAVLADQYAAHVPDVIREWAAAIPGLRTGEVFPRLIASIGNPRIAQAYRWETPAGGKRVLVEDGGPYERTLRQLWQWCG